MRLSARSSPHSMATVISEESVAAGVSLLLFALPPSCMHDIKNCSRAGVASNYTLSLFVARLTVMLMVPHGTELTGHLTHAGPERAGGDLPSEGWLLDGAAAGKQ